MSCIENHFKSSGQSGWREGSAAWNASSVRHSSTIRRIIANEVMSTLYLSNQIRFHKVHFKTRQRTNARYQQIQQ